MEDSRYSLPAYLTSPKARLLSVIDLLSAHDVDDTVFLLLGAIAQSILWSEESNKLFIDLGFSAAIEIYDSAMQNADFDKVQTDPQNPRNWTGYAKHLSE